LKIQIQQMENERRVLNSKTNRMKQTIHDRDIQINQALHQANEHQSIKTASKTTISSLEQNLESLENTRDARKIDLENLQKNDRLSISSEIQIELQEYYNEFERLKEQNHAVQDARGILEDQVRRIHDQISATPTIQRNLSQLTRNIQDLTDKITAYRKSQLRNECAIAIQTVSSNPNKYHEISTKIQKEIDQLKDQNAQQQEELLILQENDKKNIEFLQSIINDQAEKLQAALNKTDSNEPDDDKSSHQPSQNLSDDFEDS